MRLLPRSVALLRRVVKTRILKHRLIPHMLFEVCSACQNRCQYCAHSEMMIAYPGYQLTMEELENFIVVTRASRYYIKDIFVHGIGEPTLWRHFNEGITCLGESGIVNRILVTSNGQSLERIETKTWKYIFVMSLSIYPGFKYWNEVKELRRRYRDKIIINEITDFGVQPDRRYDNSIPCHCRCAGPMFFKDRIYYYCGPPVFNAARLKEVDITMTTDISCPVKLDYLKAFNPNCMGNLDLCRYCSANSNITQERRTHSFK